MMKLVLFVLATAASASKDSNYYPWGTNPNSANPMFWNDATDILADLTQFQALYIKYHSCVWSPYASTASSSSFVCTGGNYAGDDSYWYTGYTPCYRANAAFSLYGVLVPDDGEAAATRNLKRTGSTCNKLTYINSFFTTYGAGTISSALGLYEETGFATAECTSSGNNDGGGGGDNKNGGNNNANKNSMSATMGCDAGKFVYDTFEGKYCDGNYYLSTEDTLDTYNANMESISCTQIWDYDVSIGSRRDLGYGSLAESILYYSKACSLQQYPGVCPDPFGIKADYVVNPLTEGERRARIPPNLGAASWFLLLTGVVLTALSVTNVIRKRRRKNVDSSMEPPLYREFGSKLSRVASSMSDSARSVVSKLSAKRDSEPRNVHDDPVMMQRNDSYLSKLSKASSKSAGIVKGAPSKDSASPQKTGFFATLARAASNMSAGTKSARSGRSMKEETSPYQVPELNRTDSKGSAGELLGRIASGDLRATRDSVEMNRVSTSEAQILGPNPIV